jgi:hypothetical protein
MPWPAGKLLTAVFLLTLGAVAAGCGDFFSDRISEEQSAQYAERNREFAATLPVPPGAELATEIENECAGAYRHEANSACFLHLTYKTREPLIDVMGFYDAHFASKGWEFGNIDSERSESYSDGEIYIRLGLDIPLGTCPDVFDDPEGNEQCAAREIRRNGEERTFVVVISPG